MPGIPAERQFLPNQDAVLIAQVVKLLRLEEITSAIEPEKVCAM